MALTLTVEVDSNEQQPLRFPPSLVWSPSRFRRELLHVEVRKCPLRAGDYRFLLGGPPYRMAPQVVERKRDLDELARNLLTADRARFYNAWGRFTSSCPHPILLIEDSLCSARLKYGPESMDGVDVWRELNKLLARAPHVRIVWAGKAGTPAGRVKLGANLLLLSLTLEIPDVRTQTGSRREANGLGALPEGLCEQPGGIAGDTRDSLVPDQGRPL